MSRGDRCPACGAPLDLVWVHGHGQCARCGTNVVPCCSGAGDEADARERSGYASVADLVALLEAAGGTLLRTDLFNQFAQRTGCSWDEAEALLAAGLAAGALRTGPGDLVALGRGPRSA